MIDNLILTALIISLTIAVIAKLDFIFDFAPDWLIGFLIYSLVGLVVVIPVLLLIKVWG